MARADGRVQPGQNIASAFSARAWNRAQDAADIVLGQNHGFAVPPKMPGLGNVNVVIVRASAPIPIHGVVSLDGPIYGRNPSGTMDGTDDASQAYREMATRLAIGGGVPDISDLAFGIAQEPIAQGSLGRVAVSGITICRVKFISNSHRYARPRAGDVTQLVSTGCGPVLLVAVQSDGSPQTSIGDNRWAIGIF